MNLNLTTKDLSKLVATAIEAGLAIMKIYHGEIAVAEYLADARIAAHHGPTQRGHADRDPARMGDAGIAVGPHVRAWRARAPLLAVDKRVGDAEGGTFGA